MASHWKLEKKPSIFLLVRTFYLLSGEHRQLLAEFLGRSIQRTLARHSSRPHYGRNKESFLIQCNNRSRSSSHRAFLSDHNVVLKIAIKRNCLKFDPTVFKFMPTVLDEI